MLLTKSIAIVFLWSATLIFLIIAVALSFTPQRSKGGRARHGNPYHTAALGYFAVTAAMLIVAVLLTVSANL